MPEIRKIISDFWEEVKERKEVMSVSEKGKRKGKDKGKTKRTREGEKENKTKIVEHMRKREHIPILEEKKKNMGKVRRMNTNVHDKKVTEKRKRI